MKNSTCRVSSDEEVEELEVLNLFLLLGPPVVAPPLLRSLGQDGVVVLAGSEVIKNMNSELVIRIMDLR